MIMYDFRCSTCHKITEIIVDSSKVRVTGCPCGGAATRMFPAPKQHSGFLGDALARAVTPGGPDTSDHPPHVCDVAPLATGKRTYHEWKADQKEKRANEITKEVEKVVGDPRPTIYGGSAGGRK